MRLLRASVVWLALASFAAAQSAPAAPSVAPAQPADQAEPAGVVQAALDAASRGVSEFAEGLAGDFLAFLLRAGGSLDAAGATTPEQRAAVLVPAANATADQLLAKFDTHAAATFRMWQAKAAPLAPVISGALDREADRLTEFLRADPVMVIGKTAEAARLGDLAPVPDVMQAVADATAASDSGPGFTARLQRAQVVGDREVERVVRRRLTRESAEVGDRISDGYLTFLLDAGKSLDESRIYDDKARASVIEPLAKKTSDKLLAEYDGYAKAAREAFKGAGTVVEPAVEAALAAERARLVGFFGTSLDALRVGIEAARDAGEDPSGRKIRRDLELRARMEVDR